MYRLECVSLANWGRFGAEDIEIRGTVALLGPTGAGKSTVIDAIQIAMTGASSRFFQLNKATGGTSTRSVRDYALGLDDHISAEPARESSDTLLALSFRDGGDAVSFGIMLSADTASPATVRPSHWFVQRGHGFRIAEHLMDQGEGRFRLPANSVILDALKRSAGSGLKLHNSATAYVEDYLLAMRRVGAAPDAQLVLRNLKETVAFKPIDDSTEFVRRHILEPEPIDVGGLKGSIATYRFFEDEVRDRERQLGDLRAVKSRLQTWGRYRIGINTQRFRAAHAERRRLQLLVDRAGAEHGAALQAIETEKQAQARNLEAIEILRGELDQQRSLLRDSPGGEQLRQLDEQEALLEQARKGELIQLTRAYHRLKSFAALGAHRDRLALDFHDALGAAIELAALPAPGGLPDPAARSIIEALEKRISAFAGAGDALDRQIERIELDLTEKRRELTDVDTRLAGARSSGAVLSRDTQEFMALLSRHGISAEALPDVVEILEPNWAMALEMMLGVFREALIVPKDRLSEAYHLLYQERHRLDRCRLVDVRKTDRVRRTLPDRSLAEVIASANADALAFIRYRVGQVVRIESEAELEHHDHAITRQGKTVSGMALGVHRDRDPILGRTAQDSTRRRLVEQSADLQEAVSRLSRARSAVQTALQAIEALREEGGDVMSMIFSTLAQHDGKARSIQRARAAAEAPEVQKIRSEIAQIAAEIDARQAEIREEILPRLEKLSESERKLAVQLMRLNDDVAVREKEEAAARACEDSGDIKMLLRVILDVERIETIEAQVNVALTLNLAGREPIAVLAAIRNEAQHQQGTMERTIEENQRRGTNLYYEFIRPYPQPPLSNPGPVDILNWVITRETQLEGDELRKSKVALEEARREMELALKEGLLNRLAEKTGKVRRQIARLNANLVNRRFTGQRYEFTWGLNMRVRGIHNLARVVAESPDRSLGELTGPGAEPAHREAFAQLEAFLHEDDSLKILEDYREHFDFDLKMTNASGHETTLSKRSATGSGGQKQAPYYVAIAAAMAAAYYPQALSDANADGMGLVIFDEAFNNLDTANTTALMRFFEDLHLQVIVAAPDRVRAMFLEIVDTIVTVRRSPVDEEPTLSVSHLKDRARLTLADANPIHKGVEAYRDPIAAE
jgi:uncharacterized protein YPO0396